jgi:ABC-2 type transport system permease protein
MPRMLDIYLQQMRNTLAVQFQYRVGLVIWLIETILEPVIYMVVWQSAAGGGSIGGYGTRDFAAYFIVLLVVSHLTTMWHMWEYEYRIRHGELNGALLRPLHPIHADVAANIGYKLLMLPVVIVAVVALTIAFRPAFNPPQWALLAFVPAVIMAGAVTFVAGWVVAMAAFWTTRISAINQAYIVAIIFLSGYLAPLDVLPAPVRLLADALPFRWSIAFPVELCLGRLTPQEALFGFVAQAVWLAGLTLVLNWVWQRAAAQYSAVGG